MITRVHDTGSMYTRSRSAPRGPRPYDSNVAEVRPIELVAAPEGVRTELSSALLSAVADPVRWTVVRHLARHGTSCVCDLQERVPVAANLLSYHLKVLRDAGLVTTARRGRWIDYTLSTDAADRLADALPVSTRQSGHDCDRPPSHHAGRPWRGPGRSGVRCGRWRTG